MQRDLRRACRVRMEEILSADDFLDRISESGNKMIRSSGIEPAGAVFVEGDEVVLARGPYTGTPGVFLRCRADAKWADITERNGTVRRHPVEWLAYAAIVP